jgi:hypothetical protein
MACARLWELLRELQAADWVADAVGELGKAGHAELAAELRASLEGAHGGCASVVDALWQRAEQGVGWAEPFWRECYVLACVATAVALAADDAADALRRLDMAYIMGGPPEVLQPFVGALEPLVPRAAAPDGGEPELLPRALLPAAAPALHAGRELARLDAAGRSRFRKEHYNHDVPVVLSGVGDSWPALSKWRDLGWWASQFGHRSVPLEVGKHSDGTWHEKVCSPTSLSLCPQVCDEHLCVPGCHDGRVCGGAARGRRGGLPRAAPAVRAAARAARRL